MTTTEALHYGLPRWMALSHLSEDLDQILALVEQEYRTPHQRQAALLWYAQELRRTQWERVPVRPQPRPRAMRRKTSGYRTDREAHRRARLLVAEQRRREIAQKGGLARWRA
jgi:hypothetical protein